MSESSDVSDAGQDDGTWVKVANLSACPPGNLLDVEAGHERIVLANIAGETSLIVKIGEKSFVGKEI